MPDGSAVTMTWSKVSGPGTVSFANAAAVDTTESFSAAGTYVLRLGASDGSLSATDDVTVVVDAAPVTGQTPFGGTPIALPGRIEAENFDNGGAGVAYADADPGNRGGVYRTGTDVDRTGGILQVSAHRIHAVTGRGGDTQRVPRFEKASRGGAQAIALVEHDRDRHALRQPGTHLGDAFRLRIGDRIDDEENAVSFLELCVCAANAFLFHGVGGFGTQTRRIDQRHRKSVEVQLFSQHVARGARQLGDDRSVVAGQPVHQRRLAGVRPPRDDDRHAFAETRA
jgi:hypothetical protein